MTAGVKIMAVLAGRAVPFGRPGAVSAIAKRPLDAPVMVTESGIVGDEQGEPRHHGGPDKALHHYAWEHYPAWIRMFDPVPEVLRVPGAFGENLSTIGVTEDEVCVGDRFAAGTCVLEVSQARQPCWKLNVRFGCSGMARRVQDSGRTGWYYRVIEPGCIAADDRLVLLDRPHPEWPLARILRALYVDVLDRRTLQGIAALEVLTPSWRQLAERRLQTGRVEDWSRRLGATS
ncbi:MAG TPA: MOSC domain-containing protein [Azospirillum sp.]|nr:MOSC domain-containing protein [Azospirillum sp.]